MRLTPLTTETGEKKMSNKLMKSFKSKTGAIAIAVFLIVSMSASIMLVPTAKAALKQFQLSPTSAFQLTPWEPDNQ